MFPFAEFHVQKCFTDSDSTQSFKAAQAVTTPPLLRPDALFLSKSNYSPNATFVSASIVFNTNIS